MAKQHPAKIAEVDSRRFKAALALTIAQRKLHLYIKKGSAYQPESPSQVELGSLHSSPRVEEREGVTAGLRSRRDENCPSPKLTQGSQASSSESSVTPDKIDNQAQVVQSSFEELCAIHQELSEALDDLDPNQEVLEGYSQYEGEAMDQYILKYTDSTLAPPPPTSEPATQQLACCLLSKN